MCLAVAVNIFKAILYIPVLWLTYKVVEALFFYCQCVKDDRRLAQLASDIPIYKASEVAQIPPHSVVGLCGDIALSQGVRDEIANHTFACPVVIRQVEQLRVHRPHRSVDIEDGCVRWDEITKERDMALGLKSEKLVGIFTLNGVSVSTDLLKGLPCDDKVDIENPENLCSLIPCSKIYRSPDDNFYISNATEPEVWSDSLDRLTPEHMVLEGRVRMCYRCYDDAKHPCVTLVGLWTGLDLQIAPQIRRYAFKGEVTSVDICQANLETNREKNVFLAILSMYVFTALVMWYCVYHS